MALSNDIFFILMGLLGAHLLELADLLEIGHGDLWVPLERFIEAMLTLLYFFSPATLLKKSQWPPCLSLIMKQLGFFNRSFMGMLSSVHIGSSLA